MSPGTEEEQVTLDAVLERYVNALTARSFDPPEPPRSGSSEAIDQVAERVRPYTLPPDLRRLWELVDVSTLRLFVWPELGPVESVVRLHTTESEPPHLLTLGYHSSHIWLQAEMDGPWGRSAGLVVSQDGTFRLIAFGMADLVTAYSELLEDGTYDPRGQVQGLVAPASRTYLDDRVDRLVREGAHPFHQHGELSFGEPLRWPTHWRMAAGIEDEALMLRGATLTIAEALARRDEGVSGTIVARTGRTIGGAGGDRLTVVDGSGQMDVELEERFAALYIRAESYEFDITMRSGGRSAPPTEQTARRAQVERTALSGDLAAAQQALGDFFEAIGTAEAVAHRVRPVLDRT